MNSVIDRKLTFDGLHSKRVEFFKSDLVHTATLYAFLTLNTVNKQVRFWIATVRFSKGKSRSVFDKNRTRRPRLGNIFNRPVIFYRHALKSAAPLCRRALMHSGSPPKISSLRFSFFFSTFHHLILNESAGFFNDPAIWCKVPRDCTLIYVTLISAFSFNPRLK